MKIPQTPPSLEQILAEVQRDGRLVNVLMAPAQDSPYLHWDKLRHLNPPEGLSHREWWAALKLTRRPDFKTVPLRDKKGQPFRFSVTDRLVEALHQIDSGTHDQVGMVEQVTTPQTRDRYLVSSLIEEAITSSQLEGAATTREVAKEMIRSGRKPRDTSERMILNNYLTMQQLRGLKDSPLTPEVVFELHRKVTEGTLENPTAAGRLRRSDEAVVVSDNENEILHDPPHADELPQRLEAMCAFANAETPDYFIHPVVRAIVLHFWLAYDHPFVDGNGRTARALFYWAMLHRGYWLFEFVSISSILLKAPAKYGRSFLYTETDENDLTYFVDAQIEAIQKAIDGLSAYIERKTSELREAESRMRALNLFNHRQVALIRHALKHPNYRYTFSAHQKSHNVVYQTARKDLLDLSERGILNAEKRGKKFVFTPVPDLGARLKELEKEV